MRIASNKISDIVSYFRLELKGLYEDGEIDRIIEFCFEEYCGWKRSKIVTDPAATVSESDLLKFSFAVKKLKQHVPIQYILGKADFYGMKFLVNEHVLIPRPETEELVDLIIKENKGKKISILDIGTGSGCIAIALKKHIPDASVTALDVSESALNVAKQNAELNKVEINFIHGDILSPELNLGNSCYDIVVSNPPYIATAEKASMEKNVLDHEPHLALFVDDTDPLLFYKAISQKALNCLKKEAELFFEINAALGSEAKLVLEERGFKNVCLLKDLNNKNRILRGTLT